jgi:autoinducer 2-degrading protein
MYTVVVNLRVRPGWLDEFLTGIHINAIASLRDEPGCLRFDVHQQVDDQSAFVLYEIYTSRTAFEVDHRQAPHYAAWRQVTANCVVPGSHLNTFCTPAFPADIPENTSTSNDLSISNQPESGQSE